MANEEQLAIAKQGFDVWNPWRQEHSDEKIDLVGADLKDAFLIKMNLAKVDLSGANLQGAKLLSADLRGAFLAEAYFNPTNVRGADLRQVTFDSESNLSGLQLDNNTSLGDIRWNGVDLTKVEWEPVYKLGDEVGMFPEIAIRAYRQVAAQLRGQGMNEYADRFSYQAQVSRRKFLWRRKRYGAAAWYVFLDVLAGYSYRPQRSFIFYLCVITLFAATYFTISTIINAGLSPLGAFVFSMTSFHGRGFFPGGVTLDNPITVVAALEAFVGLIIEASFIATFTERYFGK